jgi:hypothetical protein
VHEVQRLRVSGLLTCTTTHERLASSHVVLRIGAEVVDVTWRQVAIEDVESAFVEVAKSYSERKGIEGASDFTVE